MALSAKSEVLKHVPWFSLSEWHQVYRQIYSNDTAEQTRAYETLLVWKARIPKLPVGVECTLSIIQVCLRDREWKEKIDEAQLPMYYENDLCLMYSTTIMRFLNQISNIGHTKQTSMFQIAKQLKIPEWIVNLRHDAAHGHELPSISALRMAANVLLTWLHEEYWSAEAKAMEQRYEDSVEKEEDENSCESRALVVFFELWTAVGLYAKADYETVRNLPDADLRNTLLNLCKVLPESPLRKGNPSGGESEDDYLLLDAQNLIFTEITTLLNKNKSIPNIEEIVMRILFDCEAFLPGSEIIGIFSGNNDAVVDMKMKNLPKGMIEFWQKLIILLHDKKLLDELLWRLFDLVNSSREETSKRLIASLWIKSICNSLLKLRIIQNVTQSMEHSLDDKQKRMSGKQGVLKVRDIVRKTNPELSNAMWLNATSDIPNFLQDISFVIDLLLNANEYTKLYIDPILDLVSPAIDQNCKENLLKLVKIHTNIDPSRKVDENGDPDRIYSVEDLIETCGDIEIDKPREKETFGISIGPEIADRTIRNDAWEIASGDDDWAFCPFGILPWQTDSLETLELPQSPRPRAILMSKESSILPGLLDDKLLTTESRVNWENVLRKKKRIKRKRQHGESEIMVEKAIEMVKKKRQK